MVNGGRPCDVGRMTGVTGAALAILLAATHEVPAGDDLQAAMGRARSGDVVRLGPGLHRGTLGRLSGVAVEGAGAGTTVVVAGEGEDGAVAVGDLSLSGLTLRVGPARCALKVLGGSATVRDAALDGGSCAAFVDGGDLSARDVDLSGGFGLLLRGGAASLDGGSARASHAGVAVLGGAALLRRLAIVGPSREAGVTVSRGEAVLEAVTIRTPGPAGIAVSAGGRVRGVGVTVVGATGHEGFLGDCVQVIRASLRLEGSALLGCAGAAVEASGGEVELRGVDARGGTAGCIALVNGARADLEGNVCAGRGPGLVAGSGARASARANRWWTDPVVWVDCGAGARVEPGRGETFPRPCAGVP